jgi:hypothetical protein
MPKFLRQEAGQVIIVCPIGGFIVSPMEREFGHSQNIGLVNCHDIFLSP